MKEAWLWPPFKVSMKNWKIKLEKKEGRISVLEKKCW